MGHIIHPNQFPVIQNTVDQEETSGSVSDALRFLEGIDYNEDSLRRRRRRRAERTAAAAVSSMAARAFVTR